MNLLQVNDSGVFYVVVENNNFTSVSKIETLNGVFLVWI